MNNKSHVFSLALLQLTLVSAVHASTAYLIDDGQDDGQAVGVQIMLTDNGTPVSLNENDMLTVNVASNDKSSGGGGCREMNGVASIYGLNHGSGDGAHQKLAGGGRLDTTAMTAAMLHVPLNKTIATVSANGRTIKVKVNDRGPYVKGRIIDLTPAAAAGLGFSEKGAGTAHVNIKICT
ncbi:MAG: septal ring lytic transglycosylase RlpA family protein [Bdellovibrionales bacterium]